MKRLLIPLLILLCFAASAQSPVSPQFSRKIPNDSLLKAGIPGTSLIFKLPDTSWVKKYTSTYFVHGLFIGTGTPTDPFGIGNGYITPAMLHSISGVPGSGTVYYGDGHWGTAAGGAAHANNGLSLSGDTVQLGGDVTEYTPITIAPNNGFGIGDPTLSGNGLNITRFSDSSLYAQITGGNQSASVYGYFYAGANGVTQIQSGNSGTLRSIVIDPTPSTGSMTIQDSEHKGIAGNELFPLYSGKQYAQYHGVDSIAKAKADSVKGTITSGSTTQSLTFNNSGTGDASGSTFNGSAAKTLSYNSIGAQPTLVSGTNIKTINSASLLGSGNILLQTPLVANTDYLTPTGSAAGLTGLLSSQVTAALGFTPYNATNPSNFIALTGLSNTAPITYNSSTGAIGITQATTSTNGYLNSTDWNIFNNKQAALTFDTTPTSGSTNPVTSGGIYTYVTTSIGADGIVTGLVTTTVTTTATTTSGTYRLNNLLVVKSSSTNTTIPAQDATLNRYTLIVGDASGTFTAVNGTLAADAVEPDIPTNKALIASIYIPATGGTVTTGGGGSGNGTVKNALNGGYGIVPFSFNGGTSGIKVVSDTTKIQTITNFFPKGDTRYLKTSTASSTYALQSTTVSAGLGLSGGGSLAANRTLSADTTVLKSKAGFLTDYNNLSTRINAKGVGSVTSVAAGTGMSFTTITGSGTVNADTTVLRTVANSKTLAQEQTALNLKANLASPALSGTPTAPTATVGTNTTQLATTAFVLANAGSGGLASSNFIFNEVPTGTINGSNPTFNSANTPTTGTIRVYLNGLRQTLTTDYTVSGSTITFVTAPLTGDVVIIDYLK